MLRDRLGVSEAGRAGSSVSIARRNATGPNGPMPMPCCAGGCARSPRSGRVGYRRAHVRLSELGHVVNRKRVQRLWREEGLRVPARRRKRRRLGASTVAA